MSSVAGVEVGDGELARNLSMVADGVDSAVSARAVEGVIADTFILAQLLMMGSGSQRQIVDPRHRRRRS